MFPITGYRERPAQHGESREHVSRPCINNRAASAVAIIQFTPDNRGRRISILQAVIKLKIFSERSARPGGSASPYSCPSGSRSSRFADITNLFPEFVSRCRRWSVVGCDIRGSACKNDTARLKYLYGRSERILDARQVITMNLTWMTDDLFARRSARG